MKQEDYKLPDGRVLDPILVTALRNEASDWVRRALERAEIPCGSLCVREVEDAIKAIIGIVKEYMPMAELRGFLYRKLPLKAQKKVDAVIADLIRKLEGYIYLYGEKCTKDKDEKQHIGDFLDEEFKGDTMNGRVEANVFRVKGELEALIAGNPYNPHTDDRSYADFWSALEATALIGISTKLIQRLAETEVSRAWMKEWSNKHADAKFVHVFRGSSYDCPLCDSIVAMGWQDVSNAVTPPIHRSCRCYCIYI